MWIILLLLGLGFLGVHVANVVKRIDSAGGNVDALIIANWVADSPYMLSAIIAFAGVAIALGLEKIARRIKERG